MQQQQSSGFSGLRLDQGKINRDIDDIRQRIATLPQPATAPLPAKPSNPYVLGQSIREEIKGEVVQLLESMSISLQRTMEQQDKRLLEKVSRLAKDRQGAGR